MQAAQALGRVQRHLVRVDHFAGELRHLLACQLSRLLLLLRWRSLLCSRLHVPVLEPGVHLLEVGLLKHGQPLEVVVAVRLLQELLVLLYCAGALLHRVQEFELARGLAPARLRLLAAGRHPGFGPLPGLDDLEVLLVGGCLVQARVQDVPSSGERLYVGNRIDGCAVTRAPGVGRLLRYDVELAVSDGPAQRYRLPPFLGGAGCVERLCEQPGNQEVASRPEPRLGQVEPLVPALLRMLLQRAPEPTLSLGRPRGPSGGAGGEEGQLPGGLGALAH